jgi:hypothetical protein
LRVLGVTPRKSDSALFGQIYPIKDTIHSIKRMSISDLTDASPASFVPGR